MTVATSKDEPAGAESVGSIPDTISVDNETGPGSRLGRGTGIRTVVAACVIYGAMVLIFTLASLYTAPYDSQTGTARSLPTIPSHVLILALLGLGLGLIISVVRWKLDLGLVVLVPALVVLTDLDHLPAFLGLVQPIRPAHSFIFIVFTVAVMAIVIRKTGVELASLSAFFAHLTVDTGVFPPFSPVSFQYYDLGEFRIPFLLAAVGFALAAGVVTKHNGQGGAV